MTSATKKVIEDALALSEEERAAVRDALDTSLQPGFELSPAWRTEIARRLAAIESGEASIVDAGEHLASLRSKFPAG